jgi:hypothetical protein
MDLFTKTVVTALAVAALAALVNVFSGPDAGWCVLKQGMGWPKQVLAPNSKC